MVRSLTARKMPKPIAVLISLLLALYVVPLAALPASAATVGGFEIEGNLAADGSGIDWATLGPGAPGFATDVDHTTGSKDDTAFGGGSKEYDDGGQNGWPNWSYGGGNVAGKSDFGRWATYSTVKKVGGSDHVFFYLAFDRDFSQGTAKYAFELNQVIQSNVLNANPTRSQGDVRFIVWDQGNGKITLTGDSQNTDVGLYVWDDPDQGASGTAVDTDQDGKWVKQGSGAFEGAVNSGTVTAPAYWTSANAAGGSIAADRFVEFGVDLTSFGAVAGCPSAGFSAANARSITGTGTTGALMDYLKAMPIDVPSNCASLEINKFGPDGTSRLGGATFKIEPNPIPVGTPGRPNTGSITIFDDGTANTATEGSTTWDDPDDRAGYVTLPAVVPDVEYTVTEIVAPEGYIGESGGRKVTPEAFAGGSVSFTNHLGSVTFSKSYEGGGNATGAGFTLTRDGDKDGQYDDGTLTVTDNGTNDSDGSMGVIKVADLKTGNWRITETSAPTGWVKDGDTVTFTLPGANNTANVDIRPAEGTNFQNPRKTYPLAVKKVAEDGGAAIPGTVFNLYRETGEQPGLQLPGSANPDELAGDCTTGANGECSVPGLAWGQTYFWYEVSVPEPYNLPDDEARVMGPITLDADGSSGAAGPATFEDPQSRIETNATNGNLPDARITDSATLSGVSSDPKAGGSITFRLYGPFSSEPTPGSCTAEALLWTSAPVSVSGPGMYGPVTAPADKVTKKGYYAWVASYSGDLAQGGGNRPVAGACDDAGETSYVAPAKPGLTTVVPDSELTLTDAPTTISDKAILSGASSDAAGEITFDVFGPFATNPLGDASVCDTTPFAQDVETVAAQVNGNGEYLSQNVTVTDAGYYVWVASYSGDANNEPATHGCAVAGEIVLVKPAAPSLTTEAQQTTVTLGGAPTYLTDQATLSGATADATGDITFVLYGPFATQPGADDCVKDKVTGTATTVEEFDGNGSYVSTPVAVTDQGYYTWVATYTSGDGNNHDATHDCGQAEETTRVNPAQPELATTASADQVIGVDGADLTDTATLSGATADASGKITFSLYGPFATDPSGDASLCIEANHVGSVQVGSIAGNDDYTSPAVTVRQAGYYVWKAAYSGDGNNLTATHACGDASEVVQVTPRQPTITTAVPAQEVTLGAEGAALYDTATLANATSGAGGTIGFQLYGPFDTAPGAQSCTADTRHGDAVGTTAPVSGDGTYTSANVVVYAAGYYTWVATYSGDVNNRGASHACGLVAETVLVEKAPTSLTTEVSDARLTLDPTASLVDTGILSGATVTPAAGGTLSFVLYGPFQDDPTGDATVCTPNAVAGTATSTTTVAGPGSYTSTPVVVHQAGYYVWLATYSGDANNLGSSHPCGDAKEVTLVHPADASITTQVPAAEVRLAPTATLTDTATLSDVTVDPAATGTITFTLYGPFESRPGAEDCADAPVAGTRTVAADGPGTYTPATGIEVSHAGWYTWVASYEGDANNRSATHACGLETETVHVLKAEGEITTDAVDRVQLSTGSTTISDQAELSGVTVDPAATGTITFRVYGPFAAAPGEGSEVCLPANLVGTVEATEPVSGPGTYTSAAVTVKKAGYYVWVASYSGDADNEPATHACGLTEETTVVDKAAPSITTQVAVAKVALPGAQLMDTATLRGATSDPTATGTITFRLYGPFAAAPTAESCTEDALVDRFVVPVTDGNGSYASPKVTVDEPGYYTWLARYSGDADNEPATHPCGQVVETTLVEKAPTSVDTFATPVAIIKLGDTISDEAVVDGVTGDAGGTVTFAAYGPSDPEGEPDCSGEPVFTSTVPLTVDEDEAGVFGYAASEEFAPTEPGLYQWVASYSGDGHNAASAGECGDENEQSLVLAGDNPELDKTADPASGGVVQPGTVIDYSVTVRNSGDVAIEDADVLDILPPHVTVDAGSISHGGMPGEQPGTIEWTVSLDPGESLTLTYSATVDSDAPQGAVLVNTARFLGLEDTTTHVVSTGDLTIVKEVSPVAGNGVVVRFGDTLTYRLTVTVRGELDQNGVVVTDYVPGFDPARPSSGKTTYVARSATCVGAGPCAVSQPSNANGHLITWRLGRMEAGTSRVVTFQVTIDRPQVAPGTAVAVDVLNAGAVKSVRVPLTPSNEVVTPVTEVLGVKIPNKPKPPASPLPRTGSAVPVGPLASVAVVLLGLGLVLVAAGTRPGRHRRA